MTVKDYEMVEEMKQEIKDMRSITAKTDAKDEEDNAYLTGKIAAYRECLDIINKVFIQFEKEQLANKWKERNDEKAK